MTEEKKEHEKDENCERAQEVASKYGYQLVCDDDDLDEKKEPVDPGCEEAQEVAGKYGYQIVCDD